MRLNDAPLDVRTGAANTFHSNWVASKNTAYWLTPTGDGVVGDSLRHRIRVIRDGKPTISVAEEADSTSRKRRHFTGNIQDDYGFSRLSFVWAFAEKGARTQADEASATSPEPQAQRRPQELDVPVGRQGAFFHTWEMGAIDWREGDVLECWFEVWDNDGVHGAKMTRSGTTRIAAPSQDDIREERNETAQSIEDNLDEASREAAELREAMEAMQERLREQGRNDLARPSSHGGFDGATKSASRQARSHAQGERAKDERANEFSKQEERILDKQEQLQNSWTTS